MNSDERKASVTRNTCFEPAGCACGNVTLTRPISLLHRCVSPRPCLLRMASKMCANSERREFLVRRGPVSSASTEKTRHRSVTTTTAVPYDRVMSLLRVSPAEPYVLVPCAMLSPSLTGSHGWPLGVRSLTSHRRASAGCPWGGAECPATGL